MIAPWTMVVVAISPDIKMHNIPFNNKEACVRAATLAHESSSSHMGYICISADTGETLKFGKFK